MNTTAKTTAMFVALIAGALLLLGPRQGYAHPLDKWEWRSMYDFNNGVRVDYLVTSDAWVRISVPGIDRAFYGWLGVLDDGHGWEDGRERFQSYMYENYGEYDPEGPTFGWGTELGRIRGDKRVGGREFLNEIMVMESTDVDEDDWKLRFHSAFHIWALCLADMLETSPLVTVEFDMFKAEWTDDRNVKDVWIDIQPKDVFTGVTREEVGEFIDDACREHRHKVNDEHDWILSTE